MTHEEQVNHLFNWARHVISAAVSDEELWRRCREAVAIIRKETVDDGFVSRGQFAESPARTKRKGES